MKLPKPIKKLLRSGLALIFDPEGNFWASCQAIYDKASFKTVYRTLTKSSIFFEEDELCMCSLFHYKAIDLTLELFQPNTVLDLGCGTGISLDYFLSHGVDVFGIEGSDLAIARAKHPERIQKCNLNQPVNLHRRFDLIWCMEVVEHIHPKYLDHLMTTFSNHSDRVVLSAAPPGQGGEGHFNEQPPEYWIAIFAKHGFEHDTEPTRALRALGDYFSDNMLAFTKRKADYSS